MVLLALLDVRVGPGVENHPRTAPVPASLGLPVLVDEKTGRILELVPGLGGLGTGLVVRALRLFPAHGQAVGDVLVETRLALALSVSGRDVTGSGLLTGTGHSGFVPVPGLVVTGPGLRTGTGHAVDVRALVLVVTGFKKM